MPKTPSTQLFDLIQTLTKSEKRYFKLFVSKQANPADNKYLQLFDAIDQQTTYDDEALRQIIYGATALKSRKFSELKHYLYELILKALQSYDEKTSIDFKIKNTIKNIRVLAKRALYKDCKLMIEKAKKLAYEYEQYLDVLELLYWDKKIAYAESDIVFLDENLEKISQEEHQCIQKIQGELAYWNVYFDLLIQSKKEATLRSEEKRKRLKQTLKNPLLQPAVSPPTYQSEILLHRIYSYYHFSVGEYEAFFQRNQRLIQLMESHPLRLKEDPSHYISVINNQVFSSGMLRKYDEVENLLTKLYEVDAVTYDDRFKIFTQYYLNKLILCIEKGNFAQGLRVIEEREQQKKHFKKQLFQANFYFLYAYTFFGIGKYDMAVAWLNQLLDLPKTIVRQDLQSVARIVYLIVHYEMGNSLLLESLLRSTYRFLRKQDRFYEFEARILKFIKKSKNTVNKKELKQGFLELKTDLLQLTEKDSEKTIFRYFNFIAWLDSKINEKDFALTVQSLYEKNS